MSTAAPEPAAEPAAAFAVPDEAVRLALELAFGVAVLGQRQRPPLAVPAGLRPFLRFQKLPPAALGPLRRAVEADVAFRERVASVADEEVVGRAGSLWLRRPEGWEDALAGEVATPDETMPTDRRDRGDAVRIERAERAAARANAELAVSTEALAAERERTAARDGERARLEADLARLGGLVDDLARRVETAEDAARESEGQRLAADVRANALVAERRALEARLAETARERDVPVTKAAEPPVVAAPAPAPDDLARRLAPLVRDAAGAVAGLARALQRIGAELDGPAATEVAATRTVRRPAHPPPVAPVRPPRPAVRARQPVALPPRVRPDSTEAALHLLRRPGAAALVDGYNVAKTAFPGARTIADERDWLGDVLDELAARLGVDVRVVFDGADVPPVPARRRAVQVLFSPAGVTADDVLVELTCSLPIERSVVVVTNDLALRERVKLYGANVLAAEQLLAVARR